MAHHTVAVAGMLVETVQGAQPTMDHGGIHHPRLALHFVADPSDSKIRFLERRNCKFAKVPMIIHFWVVDSLCSYHQPSKQY